MSLAYGVANQRQMRYTISNMEFEQKTADRSSDISNEARLAATSRKVVLEPIHTNVVPEEAADGAAIVRPTDVPIANVASDMEATSAMPTASAVQDIAGTPDVSTPFAGLPTRPHTQRTVVLAAALVTIVTGVVIYLLSR